MRLLGGFGEEHDESAAGMAARHGERLDDLLLRWQRQVLAAEHLARLLEMVAAAVPFVGERLLDAADAVVEGIGGVGRAARELPAALLDDPVGSNGLCVRRLRR